VGAGATAGGPRRPLYVYSGGFLTGARVRRILDLSGWDIRLGKPGPCDHIGVWGQRPVAARGQAIARATGAGVVTVEDAFLRSLFPGRAGEPTLGLLLDASGVHYDATRPSDLETLLATHPLDDPALLDRARAWIARMRAAHLTKFAAVDPDLTVPAPGFVLVVDQTRDDASVAASGGDAAAFRTMLAAARDENPGARIIVKTHPETARGSRPGHFGAEDAGPDLTFVTGPVSPWRLFASASAVYTFSSGLGFEAILAGHRPRVFGQPFYAGWGVSDDVRPVRRRGRSLTPDQLFAAAMILYPVWYDPFRDRLCAVEEVMDALEAQARAWREDRQGYVATGMRMWKRGHLRRFYGQHAPLRFRDRAAVARAEADRLGRPLMVWAGQEDPAWPADIRVEDGTLRSRGLGARLVPPLSLVRDDLGIHYDPTRESRLDRLIAASRELPESARARAERLIARLVAVGLTKYNTGGATLPDLPAGRRILVAGQVEDDASVLKGCGEVATNAGLLASVRAANPDAVILWKPHPDVEAGLRRGAVTASDLRAADAVLSDTSAAAALSVADEVWTMTSTLGFEALLRGLSVTCLGLPFYAGWGLTHDLMPAPPWRDARPDLPALVHAVLIDYPRYVDPVTGLPCPVEVAVERLAEGVAPSSGPWVGLLAKLQGLRATLGLR
jgi:capsular polysaccharide export protein